MIQHWLQLGTNFNSEVLRLGSLQEEENLKTDEKVEKFFFLFFCKLSRLKQWCDGASGVL